MKSGNRTGIQQFFHKMKVMFKNIWKLIKKLFIFLYNKVKDNKISKIVLASIVILILIIDQALIKLERGLKIKKKKKMKMMIMIDIMKDIILILIIDQVLINQKKKKKNRKKKQK